MLTDVCVTLFCDLISPRTRLEGNPSVILSADPFGTRWEYNMLQGRAAPGPGRAQRQLIRGIPRSDAVERRRGKVELIQLRKCPKHRRQADKKALGRGA